YAACEAAREGDPPTGRVGAGTGATVGAWRGPEGRRPGSLGAGLQRHGELEVAAIVAVNAFGDLRERAPEELPPLSGDPLANTTIGAILTNGRLTKRDCLL